MKKTNLIKIVFFFLIAFIFEACNKKNLDITSPQITEGSFFTSEAEYRMAIVGVYATLTDYFSSASIGGANNTSQTKIWTLPGDDIAMADNSPFDNFQNMNPGNGDVSNFFRSSYVMLNRANKVLFNVRNAKPGVFNTPNLQKHNEGEMLFLRAYGHYMLWNVFGMYAPLDTLTNKSLDQLNPSSSTGTQLLDQAIRDLTLAGPLLPASWDNANTGRVTANAAYGLLGKCLVFRATVSNTAADYTAAITAIDKISGRILVPNFADNFNFEKENNPESLFEFQAGAPLRGPGQTNVWLANDAADIGVSSAYWGSFGFWDLPNAGGNNSWMGGGWWFPTDKLKNIFAATDPRKELTFGNYAAWGTPSIKKYISANRNDAHNASVNNPRILRYADVILLKAEAVLNSGGSTSTAIGLINQVRERARNMVTGGTVPLALNAAETNRTTIMQWIMDERLMELAAEGQRWFDIRRWAIGGKLTLNNAFFSAINSAQMRFETKNLNFPIPFSETDRNVNITPTPGF